MLQDQAFIICASATSGTKTLHDLSYHIISYNKPSIFNPRACKNTNISIYFEAWKCQDTSPWTQIRELKYDDLHIKLPRDTNVVPLTDRQIWSESTEALVFLLHCDICSLGLRCLPWCCFTIWQMLQGWVLNCAHSGMPWPKGGCFKIPSCGPLLSH